MTSTELTPDTLRVRFAKPWSLEDYSLFLRTKALPETNLDYRWQDDSYTLSAPSRFAEMLGMTPKARTAADLPFCPAMWDYQRWSAEKALAAKRYAAWWDCGLGKTVLQLEFARQAMHRTGGRALILAPIAVCNQTVDEAAKFYPDDASMIPTLLHTRDALAGFCSGEKEKSFGRFAICNYEKLIAGQVPEMKWLAALVCDESSLLKSGGGVIKWNLIKSARGIEYKLSCTATPAPNDTMEYASQASFLEKLRTEGEILWTYFHRDNKTNGWKVKPHAREAFFRFMASWSIYLRKPSAYGFRDPFADIPEPEIIEIKVESTPEQDAEALKFMRSYDPHSLLPKERLGVRERSKLSQLAKGFLYEGTGSERKARKVPSGKPEVIADIVRDALKEGKQVLVWTVFDEESDILARLLGDKVTTLHGKDRDAERLQKLDAFRHGKIACLISKAELLGYGLNFQFCTRMVFSGFDDSFERFYQAVRRCYRYGSREQLKVYVPYIPGLENHIWENVLRKKGQWETDTAEQERRYREALTGL